MFKYNEASDLRTGELVIPLRKEGTNIICLNSDQEEVAYLISDFDFAKTVEERETELALKETLEQMEKDMPEEEEYIPEEDPEEDPEVPVVVKLPALPIKISYELTKATGKSIKSKEEKDEEKIIKKKFLDRYGFIYDNVDNVVIDTEIDIIK